MLSPAWRRKVVQMTDREIVVELENIMPENSMVDLESVRFFYLHGKTRHVTVGRIFFPENSSMVAFSYSVCNPKDRFNRKFGRTVVSRRLQKFNNVHFVPLKNDKDRPMTAIITEMATDKTFPSCVRKLANDWLAQKKE